MLLRMIRLTSQMRFVSCDEQATVASGVGATGAGRFVSRVVTSDVAMSYIEGTRRALWGATAGGGKDLV